MGVMLAHLVAQIRSPEVLRDEFRTDKIFIIVCVTFGVLALFSSLPEEVFYI